MIQSEKCNTQDQQDSQGLDALLAKFAAPIETTAHKSTTLPNEPGDRLNVLLREIDETVLPRRLTIKQDQSGVAYLDISNRRLVGISCDDKTGVDKSEAQSDSSYCAAALLSLVQSSAELAFDVGYRPSAYEDTGISCSYAMLKEALGLGGGDTPLAQIERAIAKTANAILCWTHEDPVGVFNGEDAWQSTLQQGRDALGAQKAATERVAHLSEGDLRCLVMPFSETDAIVLAKQDGNGLAAVMSTEQALDVLSKWRIGQGAAAR